MTNQIEVSSLIEVIRGPGKDEPGRLLLLKTLRAIRSHLGMDVAFISHFSGGRRIFRYVDSDPENQPVKEGAGDPAEQSYCQRVVDGRLPQLIQDSSKLPAALELPVTKALPVGAHLSVPIRLSDGSVYGTFCCFSFKPDYSLTERDLAVMRVFAELTADHIERDLADSNRHHELKNRIRSILEGSGLTSAYQPLYDLDRNEIVGFECLSRFPPTPRQGPDVWFAEAARVGLGLDLELIALERAFEGFGSLPGHVYLAANLSPQAMLSERLTTLLAKLPKRRVVLELTEHETIAEYEKLMGVLKPLRAAGVRIAVDDAGAGYASFRHILRLQPTYIKLDRSLITNIEGDPARRALATAFVRFASETGSTIVAEGVETKSELDALKKLGVRKAQGYYFSRAVPLPAAQALFRHTQAQTKQA